MNSNVNDFKKMKDAELLRILKAEDVTGQVRNDVMTTLYMRYNNQIHKNWHRLSSQCGNDNTILSMREEYYDAADEAFCVAISKIKLEKIKDDKFKCVGMVDWYLKNLRKKLKKIHDEKKMEKSTNNMRNDSDEIISAIDLDVEESWWRDDGYTSSPEYVVDVKVGEEICDSAINECMKKWSPFEREIFTLLEKGNSRAEIARIMNEKPIKVYNTTKSMKSDMVKALGL